jgi:competence protein ComEC
MYERFPGLVLAAAIAAGICARGLIPGGSLPLLGASCVVAGAALLVLRWPPRVRRVARARGFARAALFLLIGLWRAQPPDRKLHAIEELEPEGKRPVVVEGTIVEPPIEIVDDRNGVRSLVTTFTLSRLDGGGGVRVAVGGRTRGVAGGMNVAAEGQLHVGMGPRNPGDLEETTERAAFLSVPHPGCLRRLPRAAWPTTAGALGAARERLHRVVEALYGERMRGFVLAMVLGDRRLLDPQIHDALLLTGTFHLLAISGLHVTLVMFLVLRIPLPARVRVPARILFLTVFTVLTGASPPVVRAAVMFALGVIAERFRRKPLPLNTLGWSALLLLGIDPRLIRDVGFQLSFVSVAAMLTWGARLAPRAGSLAAPLRALCGSLGVSVGTSAGTAPLILLHFQRVHLLGPIWNLFAYPLTVVPLAGGSLSIALGLVHPALGLPVAWAVERASEALLIPLALGAAIPGSALSLPPPPILAVIASYAVLLAGLRDGLRRLCAAGGVAVIVIGAGATIPRPPAPELWTFDVGQGDAALLRVPGAGSFLVDAGARGNDARAGANLARAALSAGSRAIAGAFFTHPHADHLRGFQGLADRLRAARVWMPAGFELAPAGRQAAVSARSRGVAVAELSRGASLEFPVTNGLRIEVLFPPGDGSWPGAGSVNDASLAARVTVGTSPLLLLGDLEERGLAGLFAVEPDLRADGLLAPHHGRANKLWPVLLERARPRFVLISGSGDGGARELAAWLEAEGVAVFATWRGGAIRTTWSQARGWTPAYWRSE